ncbi:hypothetical protein ACFT1A_26705 [Rhodococcus sp. NPDC057135]|uniref:hypothetical protein n=1 Tax=Rhodococcus sp. NPDC057135 TaxID=3346028 RepID=UPI00362E75F8
MAKADHGTGSPEDHAALAAVRLAASSGVAFPLSATHYGETLAVTDPGQRRRLAHTIASISCMRTLRSPHVLIKHQLLTAMHEQIGLPTFRPAQVEVLHTGFYWAFQGVRTRGFTIGAPDADIPEEVLRKLPVSVTEINQWAEMRMLAGARDQDVEALRKVGYNPEGAALSFQQRVDFESEFAAKLRTGEVKPRNSDELRVFVQAREVMHEHIDTLNELFAEYRVPFSRTFGDGDPSSRQAIVKFIDAVPSVRVAVDLKAHLFRNPQKVWTRNAVRDIDALSAAVPYCDVVVADREMTDLLARSGTASAMGTTVLRKISELIDVLPPLAERAQLLGDDRTGWGGSTFRIEALPGVDI